MRDIATDYLRHPVIAVALGLVLIHALFRTWMLAPGWFYTDDYLLLSQALSDRFDLAYVLLPENGHLMPATRVIYYVVAQSGWLNWPLAVAIAISLQVGASLCAVWMLVTLFGRRWAVLGLLGIYLTTAITAQASLWWISAINQTPVQIAMCLAVGCWVNYLRTSRARWLAGTVFAVLLSLLFFQKGLLILVVLVFLMFAYFLSGSMWTRISDSLRRYWPAAVALGGVSGAYLIYYVNATEDSGAAAAGDWVGTFSAMFLNAFATGITGGPNGWSSRPGGAWADPSTAQLLVSWTIILGVVACSIALRHRAARSWVLLIVYYAAMTTTITATRSGVFGSEIALAYRLQTEGAVVAVLVLGLAFLPLLGAVESSEARKSMARRPPVRPQLVAAVTLAGVCINGLGNWAWFANDWHDANDSKRYTTRLHNDMVRLGRVDLADAVVPASVLSTLAAPRNRLSTVAPALLGDGASFPETTGRLVRVSPQGRMYQAIVEPATKGSGRPAGSCGWRIAPGSWTRIPMRTPTDPGLWWIRLGYLSAGSGQATVRVGKESMTVQLDDGLQSAFIRTEEPVTSVVIGDLTSEVEICLDTVEVGTLQLGARQ